MGLCVAELLQQAELVEVRPAEVHFALVVEVEDVDGRQLHRKARWGGREPTYPSLVPFPINSATTVSPASE